MADIFNTGSQGVIEAFILTPLRARASGGLECTINALPGRASAAPYIFCAPADLYELDGDGAPVAAKVIFGCSAQSAGVRWGLLQECTELSASDPDVYNRPDGPAAMVILRNCRVELTMRATLLRGTGAPEPGDRIVFRREGTGQVITAITINSRKVYAAGAVAEIAVNATHWPGLK